MLLLGATALGPLQPKWVCYVVRATRSAHRSRKLWHAGSTDTLVHMELAKEKSIYQNNLQVPQDGWSVSTQVPLSVRNMQTTCVA